MYYFDGALGASAGQQFEGRCAQLVVWDEALTEAQYYAAVRRLIPRWSTEP
jgi:hypothetical protein